MFWEKNTDSLKKTALMTLSSSGTEVGKVQPGASTATPIVYGLVAAFATRQSCRQSLSDPKSLKYLFPGPL